METPGSPRRPKEYLIKRSFLLEANSSREELPTLTPNNVFDSPIHEIVLPISNEDIEVEHWICANASDFVSELYELYLYCEQDYKTKKHGFPQGYSYLWQGEALSGSDYMNSLFEYFFDCLDDSTLFVEETIKEFPLEFKNKLSKMFTRMLRIFSILLKVELKYFMKNKRQYMKLRTCFKRFVYFTTYWELVDFEGDDILPVEFMVKKEQCLFKKDFEKYKRIITSHYLCMTDLKKNEFLEKYKDIQNYSPATERVTIHWEEDDFML